MDYSIVGALAELGFFGLLFGAGLGIAAKKFSVEVDPRVEKIIEALPSANCGACGFPGCSGYAKAVVAQTAPVNACIPGGGAVASQISSILGVAATNAAEPKVAVCSCNGGKRAFDKFEFEGIGDCRAVKLVAGGQKTCPHGCLGFGNCAKVCPFGALTMGDDNLPLVDFDKCTGCGICVRECPNAVMKLVPKSLSVFVACNSTNSGVFVKKACETGCIGCMMCQRNCPESAITITNNLASIDATKCTGCGICISVCPTKTILSKFDVVLASHNGKPFALPKDPDATAALLEKIKEAQKQKKAAATEPAA